jgi:predicted metal-dependent phosphoesterase TrpH
MLIDMHNHTTISSPCSGLSPQELIETARARGLDGVCVTEHLYLEGAEAAQAMGRRMGFSVFRGIEARTDLGDVLVFGYYQDIPEGIALDDLSAAVHGIGGVVFVAHPYHTTGGWNLYASMQGKGLDLDRDWHSVPVLRELDGVEVINGQVDDEKNERARELAARLNVPGIGGSDSHAARMVGRAATRFHRRIRTDEELVEALKGGRFEAVRL